MGKPVEISVWLFIDDDLVVCLLLHIIWEASDSLCDDGSVLLNDPKENDTGFVVKLVEDIDIIVACRPARASGVNNRGL